MIQYARLATAATMLAAAVSSASAVVIDNFSAPAGPLGQLIIQNGVGTATVLLPGLGANTISGDRLVSVNVTASTGTAGGTVKINNASPGAAEVDTDSDADAGSTFTYGSAGPMNADLSVLAGIQIRILASDIPSLTNSITITSTSGASTASFVIPGLVGLGGPPSPFDILIPFASFVGTGSPADVDQIAFTINGPRGSDYTIDFVQTYVPEPASLSLLGTGTLALLARRRKA